MIKAILIAVLFNLIIFRIFLGIKEYNKKINKLTQKGDD